MSKILGKILAEIGVGMRQAMMLTPNRAYILPAERAFRRDAAALRKDARRISDDLNNKFKQ